MPPSVPGRPMLIDCPSCARSYHVGRAEIGDTGRNVICPRCDAGWFVDADGTSTLTPSADDLQTASSSARLSASADNDAPLAPRLSYWRRASPTAMVAACLLLAVASIGAREKIVRLVPRTAGLYAAIGLPVNVRGLEISVRATERAVAVPADVTIGGEIRNVAHRRVVVPRLTYEVRDAAGTELVTWTEHSMARTLAVGRSLPFVSAPHRLPAEAHSILVRFEDEDASVPVRLARRLPN